METKNRLVGAMATHPGSVLKAELEERGISQKDFAKQIGMQAPHLNEIIKGRRSVNMDAAMRFESALGISAKSWMNLQNGYDYDVKVIAERNEAQAQSTLKEAAYKEFFSLKFIYDQFNTNIYSAVERLKTLVDILPYEDLNQETIENLCCAGKFKHSSKLQLDEKNMRTWQIVARKICDNAKVKAEYIQGNALEAAKEIAHLANSSQICEADIKRCLNTCGIYYSVLEKLDKAPIDAYSIMSHGTPCIIVTHRYNDMDKLVFDVLHELRHIDKHISEGASFISLDGSEYSKDPIEEDANEFARNMLIPPQVWTDIMQTGSKDLSPFNIVGIIAREAKNRGISPTIAVARYKHDSNNYNIPRYQSPKLS